MIEENPEGSSLNEKASSESQTKTSEATFQRKTPEEAEAKQQSMINFDVGVSKL